MNCHEFENRLNDLLDERLPVGEDGALRAHAARCGNCREIWLAQQQVVAYFQQSRPTVRREWSRQNQVVCVQPSARNARWRFDFRWLAVAGVGIAAAIVLMFSPAWPGNRAPEQAQPVAENAPPPVVPANDLAVAVASQNATNGSGMRLEQLFAWQQWAEHWPDSIEQMEQVEEMSPGLRPLRSSFSVAFHTLWRTIPGSREQRQKTDEGALRVLRDRHLS